MNVEAFLQAILVDPASAATTWAVLADWLEERDDPRFELVRLLHQAEYRRDLTPEQRDARVRELLASGMKPVVPAIENSIGMRLVLIPAGTFWMGSPDGENADDERPRHPVEITRPFFLGAFPVTQEQYQRVMGKNPGYFCPSGDGKSEVNGIDTKQFPVESVSWDDTAAFCAQLSKLPDEQKAGRVYRLPTEAEWEYACRGGAHSYSPFSFGDSLSSTQANFNGNYPDGQGAKGPSLERPSPAGSYPANTFGLCDMHGNVWEWCADWYAESYYQNSPARDPQGPGTGECRVLRGGCWGNHAEICRSAFRYRFSPGHRYYILGFRVYCSLDL